jgi:hypothetical protein
MLPKVYIETTIPSYLTSRPSRDAYRASHQKITQSWWENRRNDFDLYVSQFVVDEAALGDAAAAKRRLEFLAPFPLLAITDEALRLTEALKAALRLPNDAGKDAAHIAMAAVHGMHFLLTWNCTHIANAELFGTIQEVCGRVNRNPPVICTPEELMGMSSL